MTIRYILTVLVCIMTTQAAENQAKKPMRKRWKIQFTNMTPHTNSICSNKHLFKNQHKSIRTVKHEIIDREPVVTVFENKKKLISFLKSEITEIVKKNNSHSAIQKLGNPPLHDNRMKMGSLLNPISVPVIPAQYAPSLPVFYQPVSINIQIGQDLYLPTGNDVRHLQQGQINGNNNHSNNTTQNGNNQGLSNN